MILFSDPTIQSIGIDLSDNVFRLVEIQRGPLYRKRCLQLHRYSEERIPSGLMVGGEVKDVAKATEHLKSLVKKAYRRRTARGVVVALPETRSFIKVITIKKPEDPKELATAVLSEAELHIPSPIKDLYTDWQHLNDPDKVTPGKPLKIVFGAAPRKIIDTYSEIIEAAGLVPVAFEIEAQAIVRSVIHGDNDKNGNKAIGIVDFGATRSSFIVFHNNTIQFTVSIPLSGDKVTQHIAEKLSVNTSEAERTKRQCGVDAHKCGTKIWNIMHPFLTEMTQRIQDAVTFYQDHFEGGKALDEIIMCGGGANMLRIDELLSELVKTKVRKADPWVNIDPDRCPLPREVILSSTTAVGLALRGIKKKSRKKKKKV